MKGCKGKAPAFQFYVKDWLGDPELQKAHPTTRGVWINLLCYMWDAPDRGKLETNERELCQLGSCLLEDVKVFLADAKRLDFCDISVTFCDMSQNCHTDVTLKNRRMFREYSICEKARIRKIKQRKKEIKQKQEEKMSRSCHANVTPLSPTPTPTPTPKNKEKERKRTCSEPEKPLDSEQPVLKIPLVKKDGDFLIFQKDIEQWKDTFPVVDILQTLKEIRQWNLDNSTKRKTKSGIRRHISFWMGKEQNKGGNKKNESEDILSRLKKKEKELNNET